MDSLSSFFPSSFGKKKDGEGEEGKKKGKKKELKSFFPSSFGGCNVEKKRKREKREEERKEERREEERRSPPPADKEEGEERHKEEAVEAEEEDSELPISHEAQMKGHAKGISALALEPSGARLFSGSFDQTLRLWDFNGMDRRMQSFKSVTPEEGHHISALDVSKRGGQVLAAAGGFAAKLFDRDGAETCTFAKGDRYLHDMSHTSGHTAMVNHVMWSPAEGESEFVTCSADGTVRLWDPELTSKQKQVVKARSTKGARIGVLYAIYSPDASSIFAATEEGALCAWDKRTAMSRPSLSIGGAHASDATSLACHPSLSYLLSRAMDDTLKVWDVRKSKEPVKSFAGLKNEGYIDVTFSPDGSRFVTGTAVPPKSATHTEEEDSNSGAGLLVFFDTKRLQVSEQVGLSEGSSVLKVQWHSKLNQIFAGGHDGVIRVLYDPEKSSKGVLMCVKKEARKASPYDYRPSEVVISPFALPLFQDPTYQKPKRRRKAIRNDPAASRLPAIPMSGPGVGTHAGGSLTQYLMKDLIKKNDREEDPREAILKHAEEAERNPIFVGHVYKKTQPEAVFMDDEQQRQLEQLKKRYKGDRK